MEGDSRMKEKWKPIEGFDDYEVSDLGRVRSLKFGKIRMMSLCDRGDGYVMTNLTQDGKRSRPKIHKLVLEAFVGPSFGLDAIHKDGDRKNNTLQNLRWGSKSANALDTVEHRTQRRIRPVIRDDGLEFASSGEAARCLGLHRRNIAHAATCGGRCGGHKWRFLDG